MTSIVEENREQAKAIVIGTAVWLLAESRCLGMRLNDFMEAFFVSMEQLTKHDNFILDGDEVYFVRDDVKTLAYEGPHAEKLLALLDEIKAHKSR